MQIGNIHKLIALFNEAFQDLGVRVSLARLESLAVRVHRAMTVNTRNFHTLDHVFNFVDPANPIRTIAALYHDIVYYQVDLGFSREIEQIIAPHIRRENGAFYVSENFPVEDRTMRIMLDVFELIPGQQVASLNALNEFLSSAVMIHELKDLISEKDLLRMMLCIEATIPFRGKNVNGQNHFDLLEKRVEMISKKYEIDLTTAEIDAAVKMSVIFSNKDIENFAERDPGRFLDNTWRLLPETNVALRSRSVYSIKEYRSALEGMESFLNKLNPDDVFNSYRGAPPEEEYRYMAQCARRNIVTAREYLRIKILGIAILEALAELTGGDAPLSLFMGDIPTASTSIKRIEQFLPEVEIAPWLDRSSVIFKLLESGRASDSGFDTRNSPLSLFVYKSLKPDELSHSLDFANGMFEGKVSPQKFIDEVNPFVLSAIARASAQMVQTRKQLLLKFVVIPTS